jgi:hypothetical protein
MGNAAAGLGPSWVIGDGTFWIFVNDYNISGNGNNSPTADNGAAVLMTNSTTQSGLIEFTDGGFNTGGIKYYAGGGANLIVNGLTTTENNLEAVVWVVPTSTNLYDGNVVIENAGVSDCNTAVAHCAVVRNDATGPVHVRNISGPTIGPVIADSTESYALFGPDTLNNLIGPMFYPMNNGGNAPNVEVVRSQGGNPQKMFSPSIVPSTNLVNISTYRCSTCTVTTGITDPSDGGMNAVKITDSALNNLLFTLSSNGGAVQGDSYVVSIWSRSTNGNGYANLQPFAFFLPSGSICNGSTTGYVQPSPITTTEKGWTKYITICKATTYSGGTPTFTVKTGNSNPIEVYAPTVFVMHGVTDEEVLNEALNHGAWTSSCSAGQTCDMTGPVPHTNMVQTWTQPQKFNAFATATNCAVNSASPAPCGSAASGVFAIPPLTSSYTVNTVAVTSNSRIFLQPTSDNTGIPSSPTCATLAVAGINMVSSRSAGKSFTISILPTKGTTCFYYWIVD